MSTTTSLLLRIRHLVAGLVLLLHIARNLALPERNLVILLNDTAASTAARHENVRNTATLQVILPAHVTALNGQNRKRQQGNNAGEAREEAGRVEPVEALERGILVQSVVDTAEEDARAECPDQAWQRRKVSSRLALYLA